MKKTMQIAAAIALTAVALASCGQDRTRYVAGRTLDRSVYVYDDRVGQCFLAYRAPGDARPDLSYVPCTPKVMALAKQQAAQ